jgi:hypothetical protein
MYLEVLLAWDVNVEEVHFAVLYHEITYHIHSA